ncbi:hypothetical protein Dimus_029110, partial [Dionaea muscipula]
PFLNSIITPGRRRTASTIFIDQEQHAEHRLPKARAALPAHSTTRRGQHRLPTPPPGVGSTACLLHHQ